MNEMPQPLLRSREYSRGIDYLSMADLWSIELDFPWATSMVGRYPLPTFQRPLCWTKKAKISFIESIYYNLDLGSMTVNDEHPKGTHIENSCVILDGQQRLDAIMCYIHNEFKVFGSYYKDVVPRDKLRFRGTPIPVKVVNTFDVTILKQVYNTLNFAGKRHRKDQKA